jgi:maleamate amidohydrolase
VTFSASPLSGLPWDGVFSEDELAIASRGGYGRRVGSRGRPALLIVDVVRGFTGDEGETMAEGLAKYRQCCGPSAWLAIPAIVRLRDRFREAGWPIIFTRAAPESEPSAIQLAKNRRAASTTSSTRALANEFLPELLPSPADVVIEKPRPSAFFGTPLLDILRQQRVGRLIVTGCTTSGCVRATVNDGFANDLPMLVPHEGVFDRFATSHRVNLFDMNAKYADVVSIADLLEELGDDSA